jgi:opacity protein-like surface antigen
MSVPSLRNSLLVACTLAATAIAATPATGGAQDRRRDDEARARRERLIREREEREHEARLRQREHAREQAREQARRVAEQRARVARERADRERRAREALAARRRSDWRDSDRPRVTVGGGFDVRSFGGDDNRYLVQGGVDFRSRTGLGVRPEVLFAWGERGAALPTFACPQCTSVAQLTTTGRTRMLGVAVSGTYTLARSSPVRPYLLSGLGVFSTRTPSLIVTTDPMLIQPGLPPATFQQQVQWRNDIDVGLTAGAGLEFDIGPARLFTEFRYLLTDQPRPRGFGGMMPLTVGLRL